MNIKRVVRFIPKHIGWYKDKRKEVKMFKIQKPIIIYNKYNEVKNQFLEIEREYHGKQKDEKYWKLKGFMECLAWLNKSEEFLGQ